MHSSILAWRIPWTEDSRGLYIVHGVTAKSDTTERLTHTLEGIVRDWQKC